MDYAMLKVRNFRGRLHMKKFSFGLYHFSLHFIKIITFLLALLFFFSGFFLTCYAEESQIVLTKFDNILWNICGMGLFTAMMYLLCKWVQKSPAKRKRYLLFAVLLWYLFGGVILILFSKTVPSGDPMVVYSCAESLALGNTGVIHPTDSYLSYYPQQMGLVGYYELLIRFWNLLPIDQHAYHFIKCVNVFLAMITIYFQYKSVHLLFENDTVDTIYLSLTFLHLPLLLYTSYVYGEVPSFAFFSVGLWALLQVLRSKVINQKNLLYALCSVAAFTMAVALRKNTLVLMIAVVIVTFLEALHRLAPKLFLLAVTYTLGALLILPGITRYYEHRADNTLRTGVTAMSYFAMGMQEGGRAPGWYNGFNFNTYESTGLDTELTNEISRQAIFQRLQEFKKNPSYAGSFYWKKYLSQWADGTYASIQATLAVFGGRRPFFEELYYGKYTGIFNEYCNLLQNQIYLGLLIFAVIFAKKKIAAIRQDLYLYLPMIGAIGGLLFHMLWEANARYIFPYGLLLLPYAAYGIMELTTAKK